MEEEKRRVLFEKNLSFWRLYWRQKNRLFNEDFWKNKYVFVGKWDSDVINHCRLDGIKNGKVSKINLPKH